MKRVKVIVIVQAPFRSCSVSGTLIRPVNSDFS